MISILVPTYNYNAFQLIEQLEQQALRSGIIFEIICVDDGSFGAVNIKNQKINSLTNSKFIENKKTLGRNGNRQFLANAAQYDWLLFVDSDVLPFNNQFITNYLSEISEGYDAILGGFKYPERLEDPNRSLRYYFGKYREEVPAEIRNKNPYKVIISANVLIKKTTFLEVNNLKHKNLYGLDYYLGSRLKQLQKKIKHIDNEVLHLGIDVNEDFIEKTRNAVTTLHYLYQTNQLSKHNITLLKAFSTLKGLGLRKFFGSIMAKFDSAIQKNLISSNPNLFLFDLYRLGFMCRI